MQDKQPDALRYAEILENSTMTGAYERIAQRLLKGQSRPGRTAWFDGRQLLTGTKSLHLTPQSRTWRLFWRLKANRLGK